MFCSINVVDFCKKLINSFDGSLILFSSALSKTRCKQRAKFQMFLFLLDRMNLGYWIRLAREDPKKNMFPIYYS